jgi:hypothetical protein
MAPASVLAREPQHQLPHLNRQRRPSALGSTLLPLETVASPKTDAEGGEVVLEQPANNEYPTPATS